MGRPLTPEEAAALGLTEPEAPPARKVLTPDEARALGLPDPDTLGKPPSILEQMFASIPSLGAGEGAGVQPGEYQRPQDTTVNPAMEAVQFMPFVGPATTAPSETSRLPSVKVPIPGLIRDALRYSMLPTGAHVQPPLDKSAVPEAVQMDPETPLRMAQGLVSGGLEAYMGGQVGGPGGATLAAYLGTLMRGAEQKRLAGEGFGQSLMSAVKSPREHIKAAAMALPVWRMARSAERMSEAMITGLAAKSGITAEELIGATLPGDIAANVAGAAGYAGAEGENWKERGKLFASQIPLVAVMQASGAIGTRNYLNRLIAAGTAARTKAGLATPAVNPAATPATERVRARPWRDLDQIIEETAAETPQTDLLPPEPPPPQMVQAELDIGTPEIPGHPVENLGPLAPPTVTEARPFEAPQAAGAPTLPPPVSKIVQEGITVQTAHGTVHADRFAGEHFFRWQTPTGEMMGTRDAFYAWAHQEARNAPRLRSDEGPVQAGGPVGPAGEVEGRGNLELPPQVEPGNEPARQAQEAPGIPRVEPPESPVDVARRHVETLPGNAIVSGASLRRVAGLSAEEAMQLREQLLSEGRLVRSKKAPNTYRTPSALGEYFKKERVAAGPATEPQPVAPAEVAPAVPAQAEASPAAPEGMIAGRAGEYRHPIMNPGERPIPIRYVLAEESRLTPSHDPFTFAANEDFPPEWQPRDYSLPENRQRVEGRAEEYDPAVVATLGPSAQDAPPVLMPNGKLPVGNDRTMSLMRAPEERRAAYKEYLAAHAEEFGFTREQVEAMDAPRLVRYVDAAPDVEIPLGAEIAERSNVGSQKAMSPEEETALLVKRAKPHLADLLKGTQKLGPSGEPLTLAQVLDDPQTQGRLVQIIRDTFSQNEVPRFVERDASGLNQPGKDLLKRVIYLATLDDPKLLAYIRDAEPGLAKRIDHALLEINRANSLGGQFALQADLRRALELIAKNTRATSADEIRAIAGGGDLLMGTAATPVAMTKRQAKLIDALLSPKISELKSLVRGMVEGKQTVSKTHVGEQETFTLKVEAPWQGEKPPPKPEFVELDRLRARYLELQAKRSTPEEDAEYRALPAQIEAERQRIQAGRAAPESPPPGTAAPETQLGKIVKKGKGRKIDTKRGRAAFAYIGPRDEQIRQEHAEWLAREELLSRRGNLYASDFRRLVKEGEAKGLQNWEWFVGEVENHAIHVGDDDGALRQLVAGILKKADAHSQYRTYYEQGKNAEIFTVVDATNRSAVKGLLQRVSKTLGYLPPAFELDRKMGWPAGWARDLYDELRAEGLVSKYGKPTPRLKRQAYIRPFPPLRGQAGFVAVGDVGRGLKRAWEAMRPARRPVESVPEPREDPFAGLDLPGTTPAEEQAGMAARVAGEERKAENAWRFRDRLRDWVALQVTNNARSAQKVYNKLSPDVQKGLRSPAYAYDDVLWANDIPNLERTFNEAVNLIHAPVEAGGLALLDTNAHKLVELASAAFGKPGGKGVAKQEALAALRDMRERIGADRFNRFFEEAVTPFTDTLLAYCEELHAMGRIPDRAWNTIRKNPFYAPVVTQEYMERGVSGGVPAMEGTTEHAIAPYWNLVDKAARMSFYVRKARYEQATMRVLVASGEPGITPVAAKDVERAAQVYERGGSLDGMGVGVVWSGGHPTYWHIPRGVAEHLRSFVAREPNVAAQFLHMANSIFKAAWTKYDPVFSQFRNVVKDRLNLAAKLPEGWIDDLNAERVAQGLAPYTGLGKRYRVISDYIAKAKGPSRAHARGEVPPELAWLLQEGAIPPPGQSFVGSPFERATSPLARMYGRMGFKSQDYREFAGWADRLIATLGRGLDRVEDVPILGHATRGVHALHDLYARRGARLEIQTKVAAGLLGIDANIPRDQLVDFLRNHAGTPNWKRGGSFGDLLNAITPFAKVAINGLRSDYEAVRGLEGANKWLTRLRMLAMMSAPALVYTALAQQHEDIAEFLNKVNPTDWRQAICVFLGWRETKDATGRPDREPVYLRLPRPDGMAAGAGIMTMALDYWRLKKQLPRSVQEAASLLPSVYPATGPVIGAATHGLTWLAGGNPVNYMGHKILPEPMAGPFGSIHSEEQGKLTTGQEIAERWKTSSLAQLLRYEVTNPFRSLTPTRQLNKIVRGAVWTPDSVRDTLSESERAQFQGIRDDQAIEAQRRDEYTQAALIAEQPNAGPAEIQAAKDAYERWQAVAQMAAIRSRFEGPTTALQRSFSGLEWRKKRAYLETATPEQRRDLSSYLLDFADRAGSFSLPSEPRRR